VLHTLLLLATAGYCWLLLATAGYCWLPGSRRVSPPPQQWGLVAGGLA